MRRLLSLLALALLVGVVWWFVRSKLAFDDLGPGVRIVTRPGVDLIVVGDAAFRWTAFPADAHTRRDGYPLPEGLRGVPALDGTGALHGLFEHAVVRLRGGAVEGSLRLPELLGGEPEPVRPKGRRANQDDARLELVGVDGADQPVLFWRSPKGGRVFVRSPDLQEWRLLELEGEPARLPPGIRGDDVVLSHGSRALAFLGRQGWEAWSYGSELAVRRVALDCVGAQAIFTPDGTALVVDGKVKGLWRLELAEQSLRFMADGNLGHTERVPFSACFREVGSTDDADMLLVSPQRDHSNYLQIVQTHLSGGGRLSFGQGFMHHYLPAVSLDGRRLAYVQAKIDAGGTEAIQEELFLFDFAHPNDIAQALGSRRGGRPGQGPGFVGDGDVLVFIAQGRIRRLEIDDD
jgi:hypothetical protein